MMHFYIKHSKDFNTYQRIVLIYLVLLFCPVTNENHFKSTSGKGTNNLVFSHYAVVIFQYYFNNISVIFQFDAEARHPG